MNKTKWIVGLSIATVIALSGTVYAMNSGSYAAKPVGNATLTNSVDKIPNPGTVTDSNGSSTVNNSLTTTKQSTSTSPSSIDNRPNNIIVPGSNGFAGGYGMGGYSSNRNGGSYGMMGGYGTNGNSGGYGMMGGYSANGNGGGYGMMNGYGANRNSGGYGMIGGYNYGSGNK